MRQSEIDFPQRRQMRRQNDASGVATPPSGVEAGVIFGQVGIPGIAKNGFHKIQIADQHTRCKKARFHGPPGHDSRDFRANQGTEEEGHKGPGLVRTGEIGRVWQAEMVPRRMQGMPEEAGKDAFGDRALVLRNSQSAFDDVEDAFGGAPVTSGIVTHALLDPVG